MEGVRQGCPLSLYLFVLCLERLSHCIPDSVKGGRWKPIKVGTHGPAISHLMFADHDILLFVGASLEQIGELSSVLGEFCGASGQKVNNSKTAHLFLQECGS